jgi:uncharacterized membrane protein
VILPRGVLILGIVAVVSIALNLFLAGNLLGRHFRGPMPPPNFEQRIHNLWRELPAADQSIAQGVLDQHNTEIMEKWRAFRPANQHVVQVLHADQFDPVEAKTALDTANQLGTELKIAIQNALIEVAQKISPEGRKHMHLPGGP